jgi:hypothetical protein
MDGWMLYMGRAYDDWALAPTPPLPTRRTTHASSITRQHSCCTRASRRRRRRARWGGGGSWSSRRRRSRARWRCRRYARAFCRVVLCRLTCWLVCWCWYVRFGVCECAVVVVIVIVLNVSQACELVGGCAFVSCCGPVRWACVLCGVGRHMLEQPNAPLLATEPHKQTNPKTSTRTLTPPPPSKP